MKLTVEQIASVCHNVNKAFCHSQGDFSQTEWELAEDWQRNSAINGVKAHIESGLTMLPEDSHISWMKQKQDEGWIYGVEKDPIAKTHPCMVPYNQLPPMQIAKDWLFRETVHCLVKM